MHLDWEHNGLGTGSCGPNTLEEYQLRVKNKEGEDGSPRFNFSVILD